ncbi:MAG TPA: methyltransferase domain-containing protein [Longimicrobiales bacterium]|nr:methyltransferase domain-containing protein [Longimicrobiales bacterium]
MRTRLRDAVELLDATRHDPAELANSMAQVAEVNRLLGGNRAVWSALEPLLAHGRTTGILDIGTGSADIPADVARRARRSRRDVAILATDLHPQMRDLALASAGRDDAVRIGAADARALPYRDGAFDVALLSLTLHHFEEDDQVVVLREAARVARRAIIVNELERCAANYVGARLLAATRWRGNRLTRHDGPISVLRAFTMDELRNLARRAGLRVHGIERRFFYRLVLRASQ